jgi:hypothetical protein
MFLPGIKMAVGTNIPKIETDILMLFTTLISFVIIAFAIFPHSVPARFIHRNSTIYLPSTNTTHPTKHHHYGGAVRRSSGMALAILAIPPPGTSSEGVGQKGGAEGFYVILCLGREINYSLRSIISY